MQIKIDKMYPNEKSNTYYAGGKAYKVAHSKGFNLEVGKTYDVETKDTVFNGKTYTWIESVQGQLTQSKNYKSDQKAKVYNAPVQHDDKSKVRSMALAYAKDLVAAKVIDLDLVYEQADKFIQYIEGNNVVKNESIVDNNTTNEVPF